MSIPLEKALEHVNAPTVTCCRFEAGTVIGPSPLEDPTLLSDFERTGFLHIPENCLTIGQVLGTTLTETKEVAPTHVGFRGGGDDVHALAEVTGPAIAPLLGAERVDAVIMTAG
jgi:hypothetical protein